MHGIDIIEVQLDVHRLARVFSLATFKQQVVRGIEGAEGVQLFVIAVQADEGLGRGIAVIGQIGTDVVARYPALIVIQIDLDGVQGVRVAPFPL